MGGGGRGGWRRLGVEHRRERVVLDWRILFEVVDFLERRGAPKDEGEGAMRDAGRLSPLPVRLKARVGAVATLGRLDPREFNAAVGDRVPIDIALELGHVDAVDRVVLRLEMVARKDVAREDPVRFQRAGAAATRDQRGHRERRTANGPRNQPLEPGHHSPCPPPSPHAPPAKTNITNARRTISSYSRAIAVRLRYQPRPRGSSGSSPMATASNFQRSSSL